MPAGFRIKFTPLYEDEDGLHVKVLWDPRAPRPVPRKVRRALQTISENLLVETGAEVMALASGRAPALAEALFGRPL